MESKGNDLTAPTALAGRLVSEQAGSASTESRFFRCIYPVPTKTHPSLSGPVPAESGRKAQAASSLPHPKRGKLSCPHPVSFWKPTDYPRGEQVLAEQVHYAKTHTNRTLPSGRILKSGKEGSSITLIAYPQVKHIYYSNQKVSID